MLNINILCHGTLKEGYLREACAEYQKRLTAYCQIEVFEAKDDKSFSTLVEKHRKDRLIALCIEGESMDSMSFSKMIDKLSSSGVSSISFIIGGSDGIPEEIKALSDMRLSFSKMTFPHQLMRVILLEQIYRAMNILSGGKYHK